MKKFLGFIEGTIFATILMGIIYMIFLIYGLVGWDDGRAKIKELTGWDF